VSSEHHDHDPATADQDHLLDHSYDGIQEYDNPLPRWWLALFWATIIFTPLYILYFHFGGGMLATERYDQEMIAFYDKQAEQLLALGEISENNLVDLMADTSMMNGGKKLFQSKCATCHGMFGEGGIGPNLTDDYWLHGGQLMDVYKTVREGVPAKGMLLGTDPPTAKPPQGDQQVRQAPAPVDETEVASDPEAAEAEVEPATS
jgi:cytochrome c oxidase cbb3-type subunit 3